MKNSKWKKKKNKNIEKCRVDFARVNQTRFKYSRLRFYNNINDSLNGLHVKCKWFSLTFNIQQFFGFYNTAVTNVLILWNS